MPARPSEAMEPARSPRRRSPRSRTPKDELWPSGTGHRLCIDRHAETLMMKQIRRQIDPRFVTDAKADATVVVLDPSLGYSAPLAHYLQSLGKPVVSVHWARSSWNDNVTLPMDNYFIVPQERGQEEQHRPQAERPEDHAADQPAGAREGTTGAERDAHKDIDVKPDTDGSDEKPVSDPEPPAAQRLNPVSPDADGFEEAVEAPQTRRSARSQGKRPAFRDDSDDDAWNEESVGDEEDDEAESQLPRPAAAARAPKRRSKGGSKPKKKRVAKDPGPTQARGQRAAADAVKAAQLRLSARIALEGPQAAHWVSRTPDVGAQTWHGENPRMDALALPLDEKIFSLGGEGAPSFKANDDGGLSSKPAAKGAYWTKRDIRTLIRYQVRRNPDSELPFDERDIAERMGHIALGRTQGIVEHKNTDLGMTWDDSYMERAVAWDREHYGPFLPLPGALIKSVIPLSEEENALLADLYVSDFRIKTAEAFILEGLWVLNHTRRYNDVYNSWRVLCKDAKAKLRLLKGKASASKRATKQKPSAAASSSTSTARSRTASSALSTAPSSVDGMDSVSAMEGDEREGQEGLDDAGPVPKKRRLVPDSP